MSVIAVVVFRYVPMQSPEDPRYVEMHRASDTQSASSNNSSPLREYQKLYFSRGVSCVVSRVQYGVLNFMLCLWMATLSSLEHKVMLYCFKRVSC